MTQWAASCQSRASLSFRISTSLGMDCIGWLARKAASERTRILDCAGRMRATGSPRHTTRTSLVSANICSGWLKPRRASRMVRVFISIIAATYRESSCGLYYQTGYNSRLSTNSLGNSSLPLMLTIKSANRALISASDSPSLLTPSICGA